jgi:hypothetical protein
MDPSNPDKLIVPMWDHRREWLCRCYAGPGTGLYLTTNGGASWTRLDNDRITFFTPGDTVWTSKIWVDPANADRLFVAGVNLRLSENAGASWASLGAIHVDHHAMAWDPTTPGRVYEGNDGGFYWSTGNGANGTWTEALNEPWTQFYTVDVSEQDTARVVGGTQDNGCLRSWDSSGAVTGAWGSYGGCGDGLYTVIDPADHNFVYACSQFGFCARSVNAGNSSTRFINATVSDRRNWQTPVVLDPTRTSTVYYGGNILNRSMDRAVTFTVVSPSLSNPGSGTDPVLPSRWVTRVAIDPVNANIAHVTYSGLRNADNNAHVLRTVDGGAHWADISGNLPFAPTQDIVIDPLNPNRIFVASDLGVFTANVAKANGQNTSVKWLRLGRGLSRAPVNDLEYHAAANSLYAATYGRGVFRIALARDDS